MKKIRIGTGAGYDRDRIGGALELVEEGQVHYLGFDTLGERTIIQDRIRQMKDPSGGYNILLEKRMRALLPICAPKGIKMVGNMGSVNPKGAVGKIEEIKEFLKIKDYKVAGILGDEVSEIIRRIDPVVEETGQKLSELCGHMIGAYAYIGAEPIVEALREGADLVLAGRAADPCSFLAPLIYEFGWLTNDWVRLGKGIIVGHLLECNNMVTGSMLADPGYIDLSAWDLAHIGNPIAEVEETGDAVITKIEKAGGVVSVASVVEQLLYEIHDPSRYFTPDVVADFSKVRLKEVGKNRVRVTDGSGRERPSHLKVMIGMDEALYIGEAEVTYAGPGSYQRAKLAAEILEERRRMSKVNMEEFVIHFIGINSAHGPLTPADVPEPYEVRLHAAAKFKDPQEAEWLGDEVNHLIGVSGPSGGGGRTFNVRKSLSTYSTYIPREMIKLKLYWGKR